MNEKINIQLIETFIKENKLSKTRFCKLCKISPRSYQKIVSGDFRIRLTSLFKIARTLRVPICTLFYT